MEQKGGIFTEDFLFANPNGGSPGTEHIILNYRYNYCVLPVLFRLTLGETNKFFVNAGPYAALSLGQNLAIAGAVLAQQPGLSEPRQIDLGAVLGFGLLIPLKQSLSLSFELRNNFGLRSTSPSYKIFMNSTNLLFGLGYTF